MAKVLMMILSLEILSGCVSLGLLLDMEIRKLGTKVTTTPEGIMKTISKTQGMYPGTSQSIEKMMSLAVTGHGYNCPKVTDICWADLEGRDLFVTCFDGQTSANYRLVQAWDGQWSSVTPTFGSGFSVEDFFRVIICGQGFKCSKVSELFIIKVDEAYQAVCIEGQYKMAREKDEGFFTVTPW